MEDVAKCASCGSHDGMIFQDRVKRLVSVQIIPTDDVPAGYPDGVGNIVLCKECKEAMVIPIGELCKHVDNRTVGGSTFDTKMLQFLTLFTTHVWNGPEAPRPTDLANIMNEMGFHTQQGRRWIFHNLKQKIDRLGFDPKTIYVAPEPTLAKGVVEMLEHAAITVGEMPQFGADYVRPEWGTNTDLPSGLPGDD